MTITPVRAPLPLGWLPGDDGFLGANSNPETSSGGGVLIAGTLYLARLPVRSAQVISTLWPMVAVIGVGASTGTFVGLYTPANAGGTSTLLTGSADQGTNFTGSTGAKQGILTTPQFISGGATAASWPYAAVLCNLATTQVSLERQLNTSFADPQAVPNQATSRWGSIPAVGTSLPGTVNLSTMANTAFNVTWLWS